MRQALLFLGLITSFSFAQKPAWVSPYAFTGADRTVGNRTLRLHECGPLVAAKVSTNLASRNTHKMGDSMPPIELTLPWPTLEDWDAIQAVSRLEHHFSLNGSAIYHVEDLARIYLRQEERNKKPAIDLEDIKYRGLLNSLVKMSRPFPDVLDMDDTWRFRNGVIKLLSAVLQYRASTVAQSCFGVLPFLEFIYVLPDDFPKRDVWKKECDTLAAEVRTVRE